MRFEIEGPYRSKAYPLAWWVAMCVCAVGCFVVIVV
jgi:hypothetical protein